jgi:hypothetical protein
VDLAIIRGKMAELLRIINDKTVFTTKFVMIVPMRGFELAYWQEEVFPV